MASLLLKQLTQGRTLSLALQYSKIINMKSPKILNSIYPNIYENLMSSTQSFIDGVLNLDREYVQSLSTKALRNVLIPEIDQLKAKSVSIKMIPWKKTEGVPKDLEKQAQSKEKEGSNQSLIRFHISPYVIFGQKMEERLQLEKPWQYTANLFAFNRYIAINPLQGFSLKKFMNSQIYGFHCFITINKGFQVTEKSQINRYGPQEMVVSFQTDADDQQFFVSDFNALVKQNP